jgi:hypothetical protein
MAPGPPPEPLRTAEAGAAIPNCRGAPADGGIAQNG